jgi:hypothetical protein
LTGYHEGGVRPLRSYVSLAFASCAPPARRAVGVLARWHWTSPRPPTYHLRTMPVKLHFPRLLAALVAMSSGCSGATTDDHPGGATSDASLSDAQADGPEACHPLTCTQMGANCGEAPDGCGGTVSCGVCKTGQHCGGGGPNVCGTCDPASCPAGTHCWHDACVAPIAKTDCMGEPNLGNCNTSTGNGDQCDPSDNTQKCPADWLDAWCNRKNDYAQWGAVMKQWVEQKCPGAPVQDLGGQTWACYDANNHYWYCSSPLVLLFEGEEVLFASGAGETFDLEGRGERLPFDHPAAPWLAFDRNGNGVIDDGSELFGQGWRLSNGERARNGFEALRELDADGDEWITPADPDFERLLIWNDENLSWTSEPGELRAASAWGLRSVDLAYRREPVCDDRANCAVERASFRFQDSVGRIRSGGVVDVYLTAHAAP